MILLKKISDTQVSFKDEEHMGQSLPQYFFPALQSLATRGGGGSIKRKEKNEDTPRKAFKLSEFQRECTFKQTLSDFH